MRAPRLTLACLVLLALPASARVVAVAEERPLAAAQAFHLRVEAGSVQVRPGPSGAVRFEAALAPGQRVLWRESADRRVLVIDDSERLSPRPAALRISVPPEAPLVLHLGGASLDLLGVGARRLVVRGAAEARVAGAFAAVDIVADGPVDLRLDDPSGDVRAEGSAVRLLASGAADAVSVNARSGPATLDLESPRRVRATSTAGAITLRLGQAANADVLLESLSGDLRIDLVEAWPGSIIPLLARGEVDIPEAMTPRRVPAAGGTGEGGRLVLRSFSGNARVAVVARPAGAVPGRDTATPD